MMKKLLKWLDENLEMSISIVLISVMTLLIFVQVIMRYVFKSSLSWSEELARYIFIWLIYFGVSYGAKIRKHIRIDAFVALFPKPIRKYLPLVGDILFFAFAVFIVRTSFSMVMKQAMLGQTSPAMRIPLTIVYAAPMVGFTLTAIRQIQSILFRIRVLQGKEAEQDA